MKKLNSKIYNDARAVPIQNSKAYHSRLKKNIFIDVFKPKHSFFLSWFGDNKKYFLNIWGTQSFCWNGSVRHWVWVHELNHGQLFVLSSVEGSSYEVKANSDSSLEDISVDAFDFLKNVFK